MKMFNFCMVVEFKYDTLRFFSSAGGGGLDVRVKLNVSVFLNIAYKRHDLTNVYQHSRIRLGLHPV